MKEIPLTQGKIAIVDDDMYDYLAQWKWCAVNKGGKWYAVHWDGRKAITMHRQIMNATNGLEVDHVDGDGLHNWRTNLRVCIHAQNLRNIGKRARNSSGFKGVSPTPEGKWRARIHTGNMQIFLGSFDDPEKAARAYDAKAKELFGEYARLNFDN